MKVHHSKHSKKNSSASIVILIVIGLIFSILTACSKEEKAERQDDMKTKDTSKTLQRVNADKIEITIDITKEGEICIQGEQFNLDSIQHKIDDFKNEYPDGRIVIGGDMDAHNTKIMKDVIDLARAANVKIVVVAVEKEN